MVSCRSGIAGQFGLVYGSFLGSGGSAGCLRLYVANKRACTKFLRAGVVSRQRAIELVQGGGAAHGLRRAWRLYG
jgi:hypothetical protein